MTLGLSLPSHESKPFDVVGFGEASLDLVAVTRGWPEPDSKMPLDSFEILPGGQTATAMVACARLGWRARYVGALGDDEFGGRVLGALAAEGVEPTVVRRAETRSRFAVALVDRLSGRRTILEHRDPRLTVGEVDFPDEVWISGRLLMVDATDIPAATRAARAARAAGVPTLIDVERPADGLDALLESIDVIIAAGTFPAAHSGARSVGEGLARLEARFRPALVVATLGPDGSLARWRGQEIRTPAPDVSVVDTTGAGDAFRGGFASAWLELGPQAAVPALLEFANKTGAANCRALGAQTGLPTRKELAGSV
jgi:sugar/nucleoside kinase (ribokinase family)